jgi:hypothetical protein
VGYGLLNYIWTSLDLGSVLRCTPGTCNQIITIKKTKIKSDHIISIIAKVCLEKELPLCMLLSPFSVSFICFEILLAVKLWTGLSFSYRAACKKKHKTNSVSLFQQQDDSSTVFFAILKKNMIKSGCDKQKI